MSSFFFERRWSSRRFPYGYLVTTSPQSLTLPWSPGSLAGYLNAVRQNQLPWRDGRCVQDPGTYSPRHADPRLLAIPTSCSRVAENNLNWDNFLRLARPRGLAPLCSCHCSTCVAQLVRAMMTWRHPHLPPACHRQSHQSAQLNLMATGSRGCARCGT